MSQTDQEQQEPGQPTRYPHDVSGAIQAVHDLPQIEMDVEQYQELLHTRRKQLEEAKAAIAAYNDTHQTPVEDLYRAAATVQQLRRHGRVYVGTIYDGCTAYKQP
jgi:DNA repair ATPase RecN